ncbi:MAG TPA: hypothetical protein H9692_01410 [Firmicutes bacterium]|nr:hypothetical protein [Bacillota bacterium]
MTKPAEYFHFPCAVAIGIGAATGNQPLVLIDTAKKAVSRLLGGIQRQIELNLKQARNEIIIYKYIVFSPLNFLLKRVYILVFLIYTLSTDQEVDTMKRTFTILLALCFAVSVFCFVGCGNNDSDTDIDLNSLYERISELQKESEKTVAALTARISSLETELSDANKEISSLRSEVTRLSELSSTMSQTITELTDIVEDEASGNEALKAKLDTLQTQYEQTKAAVDSLSAKVSSLESDIGNLQSELNEANSRIDILESITGQEPPVLNMGDTFVLKSPTGIEMLKVRLIDYVFDSRTYSMHFNIQRLNLPNSVPIDKYFTACIYSESKNEYYFKVTTLKDECGEDFSKLYNFSFSNIYLPPEEVTYFMVGLPSDNDLSDNTEKQYIIPYAIYVL